MATIITTHMMKISAAFGTLHSGGIAIICHAAHIHHFHVDASAA
jgi:hypothetical protein